MKVVISRKPVAVIGYILGGNVCFNSVPIHTNGAVLVPLYQH